MTLRVRQLAWLQATPERPEPKRPIAGRLVPENDEEPATRAQARKAAGLPTELPPAPGGEYLIDHLLDAGPGVDSGMGRLALRWVDLQAWQGQVGLDLSAWEIRTIRHLSREYLNQAEAAKKATCPAPWMSEQTEESRAQIGQHTRNILRG